MIADRPVPDQARRLAGRLAEAFDQDQRLAVRQNEALDRHHEANDQLWSGLHPEALGLLYDDTHAEGISEQATIRSRVTAAIADARNAGGDDQALETTVLQVVQEVHWTIHRAVSDYQQASEDRRHLAAEIGELTARLVAELTAAGWAEDAVRNANVRVLAVADAR